MNGNFLWSFDSQSNLISADVNHRDDNVVVDDDCFVYLPGQDKHGFAPPIVGLSLFLCDRQPIADADTLSKKCVMQPRDINGARSFRRSYHYEHARSHCEGILPSDAKRREILRLPH
jgi:hypothetical protein